MAFSQVQCLDDNHVNWRSSESKPEFFYSEEQRLALEALVARGRDAFYEVLKRENIRDFLSELELSRIVEAIEVYDPGSEDPRVSGRRPEPQDNGGADASEETSAAGGPPATETLPSLEYWPQKSDRSIPQLDLGWPDTIAYRGVTRASVYMQPPIDGQPHIKEVVRKMVSQAQKVIAVVMDMFTDVDIFKDLLDAGFKRKVAVYIIVDESNVKYFLHMCERARMHLGHLKNLRVRSSGGTEFFTRSATKFKGVLAQKFMFVDGDRAVCGSYSFTWSAARTDRNVISVLSGQVVEMFDRQFQELYLMSQSVSLKDIPMEKEPEPEPIVLPSVVPLVPTGTMAKKLVNPKYALVKAKSVDEIAKSSSDKQEVTRPPGLRGPAVAERPGDLSELLPPVHPGLLNLERANMFEYLPTWVEPDPEPGSDILGYINIIDPNIWNPQPNQMNRIKIRDTAHASAQHQLWKQSQGARPCPAPCPPPAPRDSQGVVPAENGFPQGNPEPQAPVPKPRTVPVASVLARDGSDIGWALDTPEKETPQNGIDPRLPSTASESEVPQQQHSSMTQDDPDGLERGLPNGLDEDEDDDDDYVTLSDQDSLSGSSGPGPGHRRPSVASSMSDEYFEGQHFHRHGSTTSRTPGPPRFRPAADGTQSSSKKASPAAAGPHHWQPKGSPTPRMLPDPGSPRPTRNTRLRAELRATEEHASPFGIPYSKLSQSKHLKARAGGSQWAPSDSKRRARDHKEP
ncbi:protein FAM83G isoform X2 [Mus musculus]|uniref:protein FAM83G isoform X2 n=1 Tax=Mus musculus TaxID=10090 RepID=UPI0003D72A47|nr:protein FAM83G isoform X2 [Mus musculus]|eukprot:XP_006534183.1 PREDICTED: protein FAM83G isoform X2 [Mus musculus]